MKTRILQNIFFLAVILSVELFAQTSQFEFPLAIGNIWQYSEHPDNISESRAVQDTLMPNGKLYTLIEGDLVRGYYRNDGDKVYIYDSINNSESLKYDFSLSIGDTMSIQILDGDTMVTTVTENYTTNIFDQEKKYMIFHKESINSTADGEYKVIDGLGLTQYSGESLFYDLTGAVIDGIQYGTIVGVGEIEQNISDIFILKHNYPNPFNPITTIEFEISKPSQVKLLIYDAVGNYITTLINNYLQSGNYKYHFDGSDLSSGVYFYQLKAESYIQTKKLMLLK